MSQDALNSAISIKLTSSTAVTRASGVLLNSGMHILTVAHLFNDNPISPETLAISSLEGYTSTVKDVHIYHDWDPSSTAINHDIAIIELTSPISNVSGLSLWKENDLSQQLFTLAGFGNDNFTFHTGSNIFEADGLLFTQTSSRKVISGTQVLYDYDNGIEEQNILSGLFGIDSTVTPTQFETIGKSGDSGGPLLIDNQIAAISSYAFRDPLYDINGETDFSAGEGGVATNLFPYIPWIESITTGNPEYSPPENANDVLTSIAEPFKGTVINYFLLEISSPQPISITLQYRTEDGTATAGEDYQAAQGSIEFQPGQLSVAIPVTIIGETVNELNETFNMLISDSSGQWLPTELELIATHTIINNNII